LKFKWGRRLWLMKVKIEKPGMTKLDELGVRERPIWEYEP
jgi:hypothetical protein